MKHVCLYLTVLVLCSCGTYPKAQHKTQSFYGMIYDQDNRPVNNVAIGVNNKLLGQSDIQGRFIIPGIKPKMSYEITARKDHYEDVKVNVSFSDPSYVLYIRMYSSDQLLGEAEGALKERDWMKTQDFLSRAQNAGGDGLSIDFLSAAMRFYQEDYQQALDMLQAISAKNKNIPYLYLFMADISQYYLDDPREAAKYLELFLKLRDDPAAQKRLGELQGIFRQDLTADAPSQPGAEVEEPKMDGR